MIFQLNLFLTSDSKFDNETRVILLFVLFAIILAAAYYATYFIAKVQQGTKKNNNMQVIEAVPLGQNKSLQLVRLGDTYVVIGVTKTTINHIATLEKDDIVLHELDNKQSIIPFKSILDKYRQGHVDKDRGEEQDETKDN